MSELKQINTRALSLGDLEVIMEEDENSSQRSSPRLEFELWYEIPYSKMNKATKSQDITKFNNIDVLVEPSNSPIIGKPDIPSVRKSSIPVYKQLHTKKKATAFFTSQSASTFDEIEKMTNTIKLYKSRLPVPIIGKKTETHQRNNKYSVTKLPSIPFSKLPIACHRLRNNTFPFLTNTKVLKSEILLSTQDESLKPSIVKLPPLTTAPKKHLTGNRAVNNSSSIHQQLVTKSSSNIRLLPINFTKPSPIEKNSNKSFAQQSTIKSVTENSKDVLFSKPAHKANKVERKTENNNVLTVTDEPLTLPVVHKMMKDKYKVLERNGVIPSFDEIMKNPNAVDTPETEDLLQWKVSNLIVHYNLNVNNIAKLIASNTGKHYVPGETPARKFIYILLKQWYYYDTADNQQ